MFNEKMQLANLSYKLKNYDKALCLYKELMQIDLNQFDGCCKFKYMWCLYRQTVSPKSSFSDFKKDDTHNAVKYIINNSDNTQLVYQITIMRVLKYFEGKQNFESAKIAIWLDKLDPKILSNDAHEILLDDGKKIVYVGNMEKWYALKSKVTYKLEMYDKCIEISTKALNVLPKFHYNNDLWFKRRIALSKSALGQHEEALRIFNTIIEKKKDWFLYHELGDLYLRSSDKESALLAYVKALAKQGKDEYKVKLYPKIANLLKSDNTNDEKIFMDFVVKIKINNEWKLDKRESEHYEINKDEIDKAGYRKLKERVQNVAQKLQWSRQIKLYGKVSKVLPNGKAGFIQCENDSYYFSFNSLKNKSHIDRGDNVSFYTEVGFDKKKNQETINAVNIYIEN